MSIFLPNFFALFGRKRSWTDIDGRERPAVWQLDYQYERDNKVCSCGYSSECSLHCGNGHKTGECPPSLTANNLSAISQEDFETLKEEWRRVTSKAAWNATNTLWPTTYQTVVMETTRDNPFAVTRNRYPDRVLPGAVDANVEDYKGQCIAHWASDDVEVECDCIQCEANAADAPVEQAKKKMTTLVDERQSCWESMKFLLSNKTYGMTSTERIMLCDEADKKLSALDHRIAEQKKILDKLEIKQLQGELGLPADGIIGMQTALELYETATRNEKWPYGKYF